MEKGVGRDAENRMIVSQTQDLPGDLTASVLSQGKGLRVGGSPIDQYMFVCEFVTIHLTSLS